MLCVTVKCSSYTRFPLAKQTKVNRGQTQQKQKHLAGRSWEENVRRYDSLIPADKQQSSSSDFLNKLCRLPNKFLRLFYNQSPRLAMARHLVMLACFAVVLLATGANAGRPVPLHGLPPTPTGAEAAPWLQARFNAPPPPPAIARPRHHLSPAAIAGISIGAVVAALLLVYLCCSCSIPAEGAEELPPQDVVVDIAGTYN
jgi:hypothetical protein